MIHFSKIKSAVEAGPIEEEVKPKPKRKPSKKDINSEQVEAEPVEDKPKLKRSTKKIIVEPVEPEPVEDIEDIKPKAKAKRKPKKEIIVEDLTPVIEPVAEVKKNIKTLEQVDCPKCDKPMTKTTLRYHHDKTCPGEKVNREDIPVKKRTIKEKVVEVPKVEKSTLYKDRLNEQIKLKKEHIKKLASHIA